MFTKHKTFEHVCLKIFSEHCYFQIFINNEYNIVTPTCTYLQGMEIRIFSDNL